MRVRGVVKGRTIVLDDVVELEDGERVEIEVQVVDKNVPGMNLVAFERIEDYMEAEQYLKWALIHNAELVGSYDTSQEAEKVAVRRFGNEPYLIRQFGAHPRVYYHPTTYTPVPKQFFEQIEVKVVNADD